MNHFKAIVLSFLAISFLGLAACGSVDHDPPQLKSTFGSVSPMDTLVAEFDKKLDDFDDSLVSSNVPFTVVKQKGSRVYVVGATDTVAGVPRFVPGSDYDTLKFTGISDDDGNRDKSAQTVTFSTYPYLDNDEYELDSGSCFSNATPLTAEALMNDSASDEFYNGARLLKGITVTGILAGQYNKNCKDQEDYFKIYLRKRDTVSIQLVGLTDSIPLELAVLGPALMEDAPDGCSDNEEFVTIDKSDLKKGASIDTTFGIGDIHECGTNTISDYLAYYVVVRFSEELATKEQRPQPYKLTVSIDQN